MHMHLDDAARSRGSSETPATFPQVLENCSSSELKAVLVAGGNLNFFIPGPQMYVNTWPFSQCFSGLRPLYYPQTHTPTPNKDQLRRI